MDLKQLETDFRITLEDKPDVVLSISLLDLLDPTKMTHLLATYTPLLKSKGYEAAAAYFCSWFSGLPMALQYCISTANKALDLSLGNITVQLYPVGEYHQFSFKITHIEFEAAPPSEEDRAEWRNQTLAKFFTETAKPLFEVLAATSGLNISQTWGQLPSKYNYYIPEWIEEAVESTHKANLADDYHALQHALEGEVFGLKKNPFNVQFQKIEDIRDSSKQTYMKHSCCLYYQVGPGEYCYTCPRIKEEERAKKRLKYREKQNAAN